MTKGLFTKTVILCSIAIISQNKSVVSAELCPDAVTKNESMFGTDNQGASVSFGYYGAERVISMESGKYSVLMKGCVFLFGCKNEFIKDKESSRDIVWSRSYSIDTTVSYLKSIGDSIAYVLTENGAKYKVEGKVVDKSRYQIKNCNYDALVIDSSRVSFGGGQVSSERKSRIIYVPKIDITVEVVRNEVSNGITRENTWSLVDLHH